MGAAEVLFIMIVVGLPVAVVGFLGFLLYRFKRNETQQIRAPELRQLIERIETPQSDLLSLRDDIGELTERVDFTERLLSKGNDVSGPDRPLERQ